MTIGKLAEQAQVNIQTVRYYERIGILKPIQRRDSGYRVYDDSSLEQLLFIKRAQDLGFTLEDIQGLLNLQFSSLASKERVRSKAKERLSSIQEKISYLKKMESTLRQLIRDCEHGSQSGPCPILKRMGGR